MIVGSLFWQELFGAVGAAPPDRSFPANPKTPRKYEPHRPAIQRHIDFDLSIDFERRTLTGAVAIVFEQKDRSLLELVLDAKELLIKSVSFAACGGLSEDRFGSGPAAALGAEWHEVSFVAADDRLTVTGLAALMPLCARTGFFVLRIVYEAVEPRAGLYFVDPKQSPWIKTACVWTQGQDVDASYWFPCQDDPRLKVTTKLKCAAPAGWVVESNGEVQNGSFVMKAPHSVYLVALVAGRFALAKREWRGKPVAVLVSRAFQDLAEDIADKTVRMLELYSDYWRVPYAWPRYVQAFVPEFLYGGMENTTLTINTENVLGDDVHSRSLEEYRDSLVMHELAHQWFGDLVTCESWSEGWLNEGFATHSESLWDELISGPVNAIFYSLQHYREGYLSEAKVYVRPLVCNHYEFVSEIFDAHLYEKGAMVLRYLSDLLGESRFRDSVRHYLESSAFRHVTTGVLMRSIETTTGWNPREVFDNYVYGSGHFELKFTLSLARRPGDRGSEDDVALVVELEGSSSLSTGATACETFVAFYGEAGLLEERRVCIVVTDKKYEWVAPKGALFAIVDPRATLIARVEVGFSESMARDVLKHYKSHSNGYFAWLAARSLYERGQGHLEGVEGLVTAWIGREGSPRARAAAYRLLGDRLVKPRSELWAELETSEKDVFARAALLESRARRIDAEGALDFLESAARLAKGRSDLTVMRRSALSAMRTVLSSIPDARGPEGLALARDAALACLSEQRYNGYLAAAASELISEVLSEAEVPRIVAISQDRDLPGATRHWALRTCARACVLFPERKHQILPALRRYADDIPPAAPAALVSFLPQVWQASCDGSLDGLFQSFLRRKSYGLMSMRIPQARRAYRAYLDALRAPALADKLVAFEDLARRLDKIEHDLRLLTDRGHGQNGVKGFDRGKVGKGKKGKKSDRAAPATTEVKNSKDTAGKGKGGKTKTRKASKERRPQGKLSSKKKKKSRS